MLGRLSQWASDFFAQIVCRIVVAHSYSQLLHTLFTGCCEHLCVVP